MQIVASARLLFGPTTPSIICTVLLQNKFNGNGNVYAIFTIFRLFRWQNNDITQNPIVFSVSSDLNSLFTFASSISETKKNLIHFRKMNLQKWTFASSSCESKQISFSD